MEYRLTKDILTMMATSETLARATGLVMDDEVEIAEETYQAGTSRVDGWVDGFAVAATLVLDEASRVRLKTECELDGSGHLCHHVVAMLLELTEYGDDFMVTSERRPPLGHMGRQDAPAVSPWKRTLNMLLPPVEQDTPAEVEKLGLLLKVETRKGYWGRTRTEISARPARPGVRTAWVQSGVSWRDLFSDRRFEPAQREAMADLYRLGERDPEYMYHYATDSDWLPISGLPGHDLAKILEQIRATGVAMVNAASARKPVTFPEEPAQGFVDLRQKGQGLELTARLVGPGGDRQRILPFGTPPTLAVVSEGEVTKAQEIGIARFDPPISEELLSILEADEEITIPAAEIPEFETGFLSRVRRTAPVRSGDDSYRIPEPARPVLQVRVESSQVHMKISHQWHYADHGRRQREVEESILGSISEKFGQSQPLGEPFAGTFPGMELDRNGSIDFVLHVLPLLREHPDVHVIETAEAVPRYWIADGTAQISVNAGETKHDWFDLDITVQHGNRQIPFVQLFAALNNDEMFLELENHEVIRIDGPEFSQLRALIAEAGELADVRAEGVRMHKLGIDWWQELLALGIIEAQQNEWLATMRQLTSGQPLQTPVLPAGFTATLRDYQCEGLSWLHFLRTHQLGGVLADDMGLGKTVQLLAALEAARLENPEQKFLVVAPTSVAGNWYNEAQRFVPEMDTVLISETSKKRGLSVTEALDVAGDPQLVITTYGVFRLDFESFDEVEFSVLVLDEAQQLKNHTSKGYKQARQMAVPCKFVVTGTPVENNLLELWALVSLAAPGLLGGLKAFKDNYAKPIADGDGTRLARLKSRLRPFVMRRTKEQVATDLPAKTEQILEVELDPGHRKAYDRRFARVRQEILGLVEDVDSNRFRILQSLTLLRQLALDPSLVDEGDAPSAKLQLLGELLGDAVAEGHKVLVFSQFTGFLAKARDVAERLGVQTGYLDGSTSQKNRRKLIDGFTEGQYPVFFISLKAGGFGINLTAADYCILLDPWWNPAVEAQAVDRAHRIGQERPVYVYRLVAKGTIESKVLALQEKKTRLFNDVLGEQVDAGQSTALSADDFLSLVQ
ncbi:SNF2 family helicase [Glutamicibacter sp. MNS18]|uniref:DEAD/DEAH box helicase n=1 Tax=Glutamicibacter sp. MNS18 TaxID=2989817 RepID=UPI002235F674|nr:DEAD/DEAH box helicase [Glutamicibacter sp. MNS18]MCW4465414.1 SNF2 family helicase [Glutamicibacter sp. MNS18]